MPRTKAKPEPAAAILTEAAVVVFGQFERLFARTGLRAREVDDIGERAIERLLRHRDLPGLIQHFFIRRVAVIEKHMLAGEAVFRE